MLENSIIPKSSSLKSESQTEHQHQIDQTNVRENSPQIYFDVQSAIRDFDSESDFVEESNVIDVSRVGLLLQNANTLLQHKDTHLGMALLRQASNLDSWNPEVLFKLGDELEKVGNLSEALVAWKNLVKVESTFVTHFRLANCLYKLNQDEKAIEAYYESLALLTEDNPSVFEAYKNMGNILVRRGDFDGAEELYNKAYTLNSASDVLLVNLGTLEVQRQDYDKAIYCFRKAVELNCDNDKAWVGLALVHNQFGDHELAWANVETALEINPVNRTAVHVLGSWALRDNRVSRVIPFFEEYLARSEFDEDMSLVLINLYCHLGSIEQAKIEIERLLIWNPSNKEVRDLRKKIKNIKAGAI